MCGIRGKKPSRQSSLETLSLILLMAKQTVLTVKGLSKEILAVPQLYICSSFLNMSLFLLEVSTEQVGGSNYR